MKRYTGLDYVVHLFFCLAILSGTAYLVFWRGESGWWFCLTILLCDGFRPKKEEKE